MSSTEASLRGADTASVDDILTVGRVYHGDESN